MLNFEKTMEEITHINKKLLQGIETMQEIEEIEVGKTPQELIYQEDKMKVFHYLPVTEITCHVPVLIVYATVNRQYMMDLQQDRSFIRHLLESGLDLYIIDWGYPDKTDLYNTMDDYLNTYLNNAVDEVIKASNYEQINLMGICQGGTYSIIYAALYPEKIKNLITMVTPVNFDTEDGLLFNWAKHLDVDAMVASFGNIPGEFMNAGFLMLKPFQLSLDKYVGLIENMDKKQIVENFLRMEKWIFDSPDQAGEAFRQFIKDLCQKNLLFKNELQINGTKVDLNNITMPLLNVFAEEDHLVPPECSRPLNDLVASKDKEIFSMPVGHIGMYVSSRSQKELAPKIVDWVKERG